jgi:AraC-like DNA-binding protein
MSSAQPLDRFPLVRTRDADEMCAVLGEVYAKPTLFLEGRSNKVDVAVNHYQASDMAVAYTKHGRRMTALYPENNFVFQAFPVRGRGQITIGKGASPLAPGRGVIVSPGMNFAITLNDNYEHLVLVFSAPALATKLALLTGAAITDPLRFEPVPVDRSPTAKLLRDHFFFLVDRLNACAVPKLVLTEFEQSLMVMFLHANRHNYSHLLEELSPEVGAWQVRCVADYIEAHAQQPMTLENLSSVTGENAQSVLRAFKRIRGISPLEFANQVRLGKARELLRNPDPATTVVTVAEACGFAYLSRFISDYMRSFGERPSVTLSRGQARGPTEH